MFVDLDPDFPWAVAWPLIRGLLSADTRLARHFHHKLHRNEGRSIDDD